MSEHLAFGIRWEQSTPTASRKIMHAIGHRPRGFIEVGDDAIRDEQTVLELGSEVEMAFVMQELATTGRHWDCLADYLQGEIDSYYQIASF